MENDEKVIRRALILSSSVSALIALGIIISVILLGGKEEEIQVDEAEVTGPRPRAVVVAPTERTFFAVLGDVTPASPMSPTEKITNSSGLSLENQSTDLESEV